MALLKFYFILFPTTLLLVFVFYQTLILVGRNVRQKPIIAILALMLWFGFSFVWLIGTGILIEIFAPPKLSQPLLVSFVFMIGSAFVLFKLYKTRLDALGIHFKWH